jgi:hypothetical protein
LGEDAKFFAKSTAANDDALREAVKIRMKKVAEERKTADYADRGREKARLREMRAKRKVKDVGKEETRAFLDVGGSSGSDDDDDDDEDGFGGRSDDDEEDEKPFDARAFKSVKRSDAAHAGMGRRTNSDDEEEENIEEKAMRLLNEKLG